MKYILVEINIERIINAEGEIHNSWYKLKSWLKALYDRQVYGVK